jgi:hypothetical protein
MSLYLRGGSSETELTADELKTLLNSVLAVPPDETRAHSGAGKLTHYAWELYVDSLESVLPARGTHAALNATQIAHMYGDIPLSLFRERHFPVRWCPGHLCREEVEGVGFELGDLWEMQEHYDPAKLGEGPNTLNEEIFFISDPGLGL